MKPEKIILTINGKELDRTHGLDWYDYGARNYDATLPMWDRMDSLCEKYMIKFLFLLLCFFSLASCVEVCPFNDTEMKWMSVYEEKDTVLFRCENDIDTMIVNEVYLNKGDDYTFFDHFNLKKHNWIEVSQIYGGSGFYKSCFIHDGIRDTSFRFDMYKTDNKVLAISFDIGECSVHFDSIPALRKYEMDNCVYNNCIVLNKENSDFHEFGQTGLLPYIGFSEIVWDMNSGLLCYSMKDGRFFKIYRKEQHR